MKKKIAKLSASCFAGQHHLVPGSDSEVSNLTSNYQFWSSSCKLSILIFFFQTINFDIPLANYQLWSSSCKPLKTDNFGKQSVFCKKTSKWKCKEAKHKHLFSCSGWTQRFGHTSCHRGQNWGHRNTGWDEYYPIVILLVLVTIVVNFHEEKG